MRVLRLPERKCLRFNGFRNVFGIFNGRRARCATLKKLLHQLLGGVRESRMPLPASAATCIATSLASGPIAVELTK